MVLNRKALLLGLCLFIVYCLVECVDRNNFKTCQQSGFCKRHRDHKPAESHYNLQFDTVKIEHGHLSAQLLNTKNSVLFKLDLYLLKDHRFRFRIDELQSLKKRYEVEGVIEDNLEEEKLTIVRKDKNLIELKSDSTNNRALLYTTPFKVEFYIGDYLVASFNSRGLLKYEHLRERVVKPEAPAAQENHENVEVQAEAPPTAAEENEPDMWEETFKGHTDSKPNGPESVGMDISFHDFQHVYGIPQHGDRFTLRSTTDTDPYRLYNLDVFEYELDNPMALYGSIPYMIAHNKKFTVGLLWLNAAETWIDISSNTADKNIFAKVANFITKSNEIPQVNTHWFSEAGIIDIYLMLGPTPTDLFRQYGKLTGNTQLPPLFSIAYHQCRWNYNDEDDVKAVNAGFEEHQIPMDVMWLDIEHTNEKRYFTWDAKKFPTPEKMMENLASYGRKLVTIVDPHIKSDANYPIYAEAIEKNFFVKDKSGNHLDGWCWPGSSAWPDFLEEQVKQWWASKFSLEHYKGTTLDTFTWNDMNEPSMFNGPEITFPKDALHLNGHEHRVVHNIYGQSQVKATFRGHLQRANHERRPFVLTRSTFAGSQKYGAVWTGDNTADWAHLRASIQMCLSFSVAGMSFCGADIGGFFKNPDAELMIRWYQAAAYQPFFRSHAHIDTKRREPWIFGDEAINLIRDAVHARYSLIYYWYTLFYENEKTGKPPMLPLWAEFPSETSLFEIEDQHMIGSSLMIRPIMSAGASSVDVVFPGQNELWYDIKLMNVYEGGSTKTFTEITLATTPVFQRGGHIVPYKFRLRRSTTQMIDDPFTLVVTLDKNSSARGRLYFDDGLTYNYRNKSEFSYREFTFNDRKLHSKNLEPNSRLTTKAWLERVIIYGYTDPVKSVAIEYENRQATSQLKFTHDSNAKVILIRKPGVLMNQDWTIVIS